jgi:hypothetical protein
MKAWPLPGHRPFEGVRHTQNINARACERLTNIRYLGLSLRFNCLLEQLPSGKWLTQELLAVWNAVTLDIIDELKEWSNTTKTLLG